MSETTPCSVIDWYILIVGFSDEIVLERHTAPTENDTTALVTAKIATHLVSPSAESIDDGQVVALVLRKLLPRRVRPALLAERSLERCLIALCVHRQVLATNVARAGWMEITSM